MPMRRLRDLPIRFKLTGIILLVSSLTLLVAALTIVGYEASTARDRIASELHGLAAVIGVNSQAALEFADPEAATENLQALSARPTIISGAVYSGDGKLFASFRQSADAVVPLLAGQPGEYFANGNLEVFHAIGRGPDFIGTVYLRADLAPLDLLLKRYALLVGGMFAILLLATLALAVLLQRGISEPVLNLAEVARAVTERQDFGLRASKYGNDEIGLLTDALNQMLAQIQSQDAALRTAYAELEQRHQELQREIGERRRAEDAVRALNAELEQRVTARTAQLKTANEELESFSYSVSHDLRAPLRGIDGFTRILEEEYGARLDAEAHRLISMVRDNCRSMSELIDALLAFSRLGRKALTTETVDMRALVGEVLHELARTPGDKLPAITVEPLPAVECDHALIRQVWLNLIANAVKYSAHRQQPIIRIWSEAGETETVFAISDNGIGFDMEYYDKLFGVFQRLHQAEEFPGTGVGLATVKRIVVRHGGRVWAEGKINEGATFYFALPRGERHA